MYFVCGTKRDKPSGQSPKQRTKRRIAAVLTAVLLLSLLCGCGGQGSGQGGPEAVVERFFNAARSRDARTMMDCTVFPDEDKIERAIEFFNDRFRDFEILDAEEMDQGTATYISFSIGSDGTSDEEIEEVYLVPVFLSGDQYCDVRGVYVMQINGKYKIAFYNIWSKISYLKHVSQRYFCVS